jgi:hypothetical protein
MILFFLQLSCQFFKQLPDGTVMLNLVVEFVDIVSHRHQKELGQNLLISTEQELFKPVILPVTLFSAQ